MVTFTVGHGDAPGAGTPVGSVNVDRRHGLHAWCERSTSGAGSCDLTSTSAGRGTLQATYVGASSFISSTTHGPPAGGPGVLDDHDRQRTIPDPSVVGQPYTVAVNVARGGTGCGHALGASRHRRLGELQRACFARRCRRILRPAVGGRPVTTRLTATYLGPTELARRATRSTASHHVDAGRRRPGRPAFAGPDGSGVGRTRSRRFVTVPLRGAVTPTGTVTVDDGLGGTWTATAEAVTARSPRRRPSHTRRSPRPTRGDADFESSSDVAAHVRLARLHDDHRSRRTRPTRPWSACQYGDVSSVGGGQHAGQGTPTGNVSVCRRHRRVLGDRRRRHLPADVDVGGTHHLTATYSGDLDFGSVANPAATPGEPGIDHRVDHGSTRPDPSVVGQAVPVRYSVTADTPGTGTPPASSPSSTTTAAAACISTVAAGQCSVTFDAVGTHHLHAQYLGDSSFSASAPSAAETHDVDQASTITVITTDAPDPSVLGQSVTVGFMVAVAAPGSGTRPATSSSPTRTARRPAPRTLAAGSCSLTLADLGAHHLRATYQGDATFNASSPSPVEAHTVVKASTTTSITSDTPDPSVTGQSVTVQYSVAVEAPGTGTPTRQRGGHRRRQRGDLHGAVADGQCSLTPPGDRDAPPDRHLPG